jgi:hypothetical protein
MTIDNLCHHCEHVHHLPRTAQEIDENGKTRTGHFVTCGKCSCQAWLKDELVQGQQS